MQVRRPAAVKSNHGTRGQVPSTDEKMYLTAILVAASLAAAEAADSLDAVTITAERGMVVSLTDTTAVSSGDITETLLTVPGLFVNDYGGISGLRSVSMRGLGSAHTAVYIDGIRVNNLQTGQADLGFLDLPGFGSAVVDFAQNSIDFRTARPTSGGSPFSGRLSLDAGSFNTWLPSAQFDFRLSDRLALRISGSATLTDGDYPWGDGQRRENNDLRQYRAAADLFGAMRDGEWQAKLYWNSADRTSPGASNWPSVSRQSDRNVFLQGRLRRRFSELYSLDVSAKAAADALNYSDEWSETDYDQKELQLNSSHSFDIRSWWKASLSASVQWNRLETSLYEGSRTEVISAAATSFILERFRADFALEYDGTFESGGRRTSRLSPSLGIRFNAAGGLDLVAFSRMASRVPTFNELYYPGYGNPGLRPEDAWLNSLGLEYRLSPGGAWRIVMRLDGFYNSLNDKIVSAPTEENPSIWLPYNVGRAEIAGLDASASLRWTRGLWDAGLSAAYSLQDARDRTEDSDSFGQQLSGTPRHSLNLAGELAWNGWKFDADWCFRGGRRDSAGELPDWNTLDVSAGKSLSIGDTELTIRLKARNVCGFSYETVRYYPMPGRSLLAGLEFRF